MEGLWRDVRLGLRALKAAPVVTIVATLSIALGIGANIAIFSLIDSLILRKLPVADPDRLVLVTTTTQGIRAWSYPVWKELTDDVRRSGDATNVRTTNGGNGNKAVTFAP